LTLPSIRTAGRVFTIVNGQNAVYPLLLSSAANHSRHGDFHLYGSAGEFYLQHHAFKCGAGQYYDDFGDGSYGYLLDGAVFAAADESIRYVLACDAIAVGSCGVVRRTRRSWVASFVLLGCLVAATGCGAGRAIPLEGGSNPGQPIPITPAGTYTIAASASSGGLTRAVNLTLIVH